jgi:hypothetical protein
MDPPAGGGEVCSGEIGMNKWITAAGLLSLLTVGIHVFAGGPEVHDTMLALAGTFPPMLRAFVSVMWHAITLTLAINSAALLVAARYCSLRKALVWFVCGQYAAFAALFVFYDLQQLGSLLALPQWIVFVLISGLAAAGLRAPRKGLSV